MAYTPYSPPSQETPSQYPSSQQSPQQPMTYPQATYSAPQPSATSESLGEQPRVSEKKDISEVLTPMIAMGVILGSLIIVYIGVVITFVTTPTGITPFHIGKMFAGFGVLIFSVVPILLSMQKKLEIHQRAVYYTLPVIALIALVLLI
jgi:hypothetical protein